MLNYFKKKQPDPLDDLIAAAILAMTAIGPDAPEYPALLANLERLNAMKAESKGPRVSRDTILLVAANLAGILIIVGYERANVAGSKALGMLTHPK